MIRHRDPDRAGPDGDLGRRRVVDLALLSRERNSLGRPIAGIDSEQVRFLAVDDPHGAEPDRHAADPALDGHGRVDELVRQYVDALHGLVVPAAEPEVALAEVDLAGAPQRQLCLDVSGGGDDAERLLGDLRRRARAARHTQQDGAGNTAGERHGSGDLHAASAGRPPHGTLQPRDRPFLRAL